MYILKNKGILQLVGLAVIVALLAVGPLIIEAATIRVPEDYSSIQEAVNRASPGDVIVVRAGVYNGFTVSKSLVILGESNESVIIQGGIEIQANNVRLSSIKISLSEAAGSSVAVRVIGNNNVLVGVIIESYKYGLQVGDADHKVSGTVIEYSKIVSEDIGIFGVCSDLSVFYSEIVSRSKQAVNGCGVLDLEFNSINSISGETAISTWGDGSLIKNNNINGRSTGIYLYGDYQIVNNNVISGEVGIDLRGRGITIENNTISASGTGILIASHNNVIVGNKISSAGHAIDLNGNGNLITNNTLMGGRGVHASGAYGNTILFNLINMTGNIGVYLSKYTGDNLVYGNTFWYCYNYEGVDESGKNQWYLENSTHKLGNYWSYNKAPDSDGDGITDEPYHIATTTGLEILDKYPLAKPLVTPYQQTPTTTTQPSPPTTTWTTLPTTTETSSDYTTSTEPSQTTETSAPKGTIVATVVIIVLILVLVVGLILLRKRI